MYARLDWTFLYEYVFRKFFFLCSESWIMLLKNLWNIQQWHGVWNIFTLKINMSDPDGSGSDWNSVILQIFCWEETKKNSWYLPVLWKIYAKKRIWLSDPDGSGSGKSDWLFTKHWFVFYIRIRRIRGSWNVMKTSTLKYVFSTAPDWVRIRIRNSLSKNARKTWKAGAGRECIFGGGGGMFFEKRGGRCGIFNILFCFNHYCGITAS